MDNFISLINDIGDFLLFKIQKKTIEIIHLCDEKRRGIFLKKKKINYIVKLMKTDKFGAVKMTVDEQLTKSIEERKKLIEMYSLLKFESKKPLKDGLNLSNANSKHYRNSFSRYLLNFKDRKDYIMCLLEDYAVDSVTHITLTRYKNHKLKTFLKSLRTIPEIIFSRDFSFGIQKYFTNFFIDGQNYNPTKSGRRKKVDESKFISINFMKEIIHKANCDKYLEFKSNQYFDNLGMS